jgi:hypothetical protein
VYEALDLLVVAEQLQVGCSSRGGWQHPCCALGRGLQQLQVGGSRGWRELPCCALGKGCSSCRWAAGCAPPNHSQFS